SVRPSWSRSATISSAGEPGFTAAGSTASGPPSASRRLAGASTATVVGAGSASSPVQATVARSAARRASALVRTPPVIMAGSVEQERETHRGEGEDHGDDHGDAAQVLLRRRRPEGGGGGPAAEHVGEAPALAAVEQHQADQRDRGQQVDGDDDGFEHREFSWDDGPVRPGHG